ncbi:MAG: flippase [Gemmatimonadetes bacterium]|nr:flippase [Gemmatimonadota bacterium]
MTGGPPVSTGGTLVRNTILNLVGQVLPVLVALASMPVVVRGLGPARFGVLALAWTVVGYFSLFDLGFGRAAVKRVSQALAGGGGAEAARVVSGTVVVAQGAVGLVSAAVLWLLTPFLADLLLTVPPEMRSESRQVFSLLALAVPGVLLSNAYRAVLEGAQRFGLVNAIRAPFSAATFLIPLLGVLVGWSLPQIVLGLVVSRYLAALAYGFGNARILGGARPRFRADELRRLLQFGGWVAVSNTLVPLVVYLERFVVAALLTTAALAYYAAPHELISKTLLIPGAVAAALFPTISDLQARGDAASILERVQQGVKLAVIPLVPVSLFLVVFAQPILAVWLGPDYGERSAVVLQLLAVAALLNALAFVPFALVEGVGHPDLVAKYHLAEFPLYAAILLLLVWRFGIVGAAMGWGLRMLWTAPVFSFLALKRANVSPGAVFDSRMVAGLSAAFLVLSAGWIVGTWVPGLSWRLGMTVGLMSLYLLVAWFGMLSESDRGALRQAVRRLSGHRTGAAAYHG